MEISVARPAAVVIPGSPAAADVEDELIAGGGKGFFLVFQAGLHGRLSPQNVRTLQ